MASVTTVVIAVAATAAKIAQLGTPSASNKPRVCTIVEESSKVSSEICAATGTTVATTCTEAEGDDERRDGRLARPR